MAATSTPVVTARPRRRSASPAPVQQPLTLSRAVRWVAGSGLLAVALICGIGLVAALRLRSHEIKDAEQALMSLDLLLGEETERAIQSADLILRNFQEKLASDGVGTVDQLQAQGKKENYAPLRARVAGVPQVGSISIISAVGSIIITSRAFPAPTFNLADREYFSHLKTGAPDILVLSEPVRNLTDGMWTAYLGRRINGPSGEFLGAVLTAIDLAYFEKLYRSLDVGKGGAVSLWRRDGILMARYPALPNGVGKKFAIKSFSGILSNHPSTYMTPSSIDGTARLVSTVAAKEFPLVVNVTGTLDDILADWRQTAIIIGVGCAFCVIAILLVAWLLVRQVRAFQALGEAQAERGAAVAARDHAEDQLRQAQKLDSIGQLTGGIAHDFNNLLTAVLGNLELLQKHASEQGPRYQRWTQNALEAAQRGAVLTQRLLAFSRRQPLDPAPTDIATLVRAMSDLLERTIGENVTMELRLAPDLRQADVDANQLDNAILNISINARDAMEGRGVLTIDASNVSLDQAFCDRNLDLTPGDFVLIVIADTGCGMPPAVIEQVFEPFYTTKPIGQGTGLGLSQVYGFVKQTGGHIEIESAVGAGTRLRIYLPCARAERVAVRETPSPKGTLVHDGLRVLVVEDDPDVLSYSLEVLRDFGFQTMAATNADEALVVFRGGARFNLLFTDVGLPGLNGHELAVLAQEIQPDLKVLFASGYTRDVLMNQGRLDKGVQLLPKPFSRAQLRAKLDQILTGEEMAAQATG